MVRLDAMMIMAEGYKVGWVICAAKPARDDVVNFESVVIPLGFRLLRVGCCSPRTAIPDLG